MGTADNVIRPLVLGGRLGMSYVVVFFAMLGGMQCFGLAGILYGPLIFALCAVCLYIYQIERQNAPQR